jgi:hypothetical protein
VDVVGDEHVNGVAHIGNDASFFGLQQNGERPYLASPSVTNGGIAMVVCVMVDSHALAEDPTENGSPSSTPRSRPR